MIRGIVLIAVDCLRADHVSCYGYHRATTPTLDALAARGVRWEQAHGTSTWTKPSVTSLFTGLYPTQHGAFQCIKRDRERSSVTTDVLPSSCPTFAELLAKNGWRCGAFINNAQLGEFTGLSRGFSTYVPNAGKADRLIERFSDWLSLDPRKPIFAYLHFLEAHWPYKPRRRHVAMFGGDRDTNEFRDYRARDYARLRRAILRKQSELTPGQLEQMIQMYDGAVRRLDGKLKIVLAKLKELGLRDETAVIVTADHGEEFMEHGRIGHGQSLLYDEVTHVPLVVQAPGAPAGDLRSEPVSLVDLPATLLGLAGVNGQIPGCDLLTTNCKPRPVCAETRIRNKYAQCLRTADWKFYRRYDLESNGDAVDNRLSPREWVATRPHRLRHELYDLTSDPRERANLAESLEHANVLGRMDAEMDRWWRGLATGTGDAAGGEVEIDQRVVQRLRDLGYLE